MPILKSYNIVTNDIRNNDNVFFMYLENKKRIGGGHIAMLLRDSSHALPLTVKKSNGQGILHYFTKDDVAPATEALVNQFSFIRDILNRGCVVVFPMECLVDNEFVEDLFKEASPIFAENFFSRLNNLFERYKAKRYVA